MGLLSTVLTLPIAPLRGVQWTVQQVISAAERQYYDPSNIRRELAELASALEAGTISEGEFDQREDELLDRLEQVEPACGHSSFDERTGK